MNRNREFGRKFSMAFALSSAGKGKGRTVKLPDDVRTIRERMELSQSAFAALLGVSLRTLQDWEQGRAGRQGSLVNPLFLNEIND